MINDSGWKSGHNEGAPTQIPGRLVWDRRYRAIRFSYLTALVRIDPRSGEGAQRYSSNNRLDDIKGIRKLGTINCAPTKIFKRSSCEKYLLSLSNIVANSNYSKIILLLLLLLFNISTLTLAQPSAFVINNLAETLSRIDLTTGAVQNHVTTLGDTPSDIVYNNGFLYVLNSISADLQRIDPITNQVILDIPLTIGSNPYSVVVDGSFAYVSCLVSGEIDRRNLSDGQPQGAVVIGGCPEGMLIYDNHLYAAQTGFNPGDFSYGQGRMAIIDLASFAVEREVNVGKNPQAIFAAPDGKLHIVCTGNYDNIAGAIYIYDPNSQALEDSILIGGQLSMGVVGNNAIAYLAAGGWVDHGYIYSYNTLTKGVIHGPSNPILSGIGVWSLAVDSLGLIYSCNYGNDTVSKLSPSGQALASYSVGDGPQSMVILDDRAENVADNPRPLPSRRLLKSYPNPFNAEAIIEYQLPLRSEAACLAIYDIGGRVVRRLNLGTEGDIGMVTWNGKDESGANCASGLYFARLEVRAGCLEGLDGALKILLIR
jgi:hypothetical protein